MSILEINSRLSTIVATAEADLRRLVLDAGKAIASELAIDTVTVGDAAITPATGVVSVSGVPALIALAQEMTKSVGIAFAKPVEKAEAVADWVIKVEVDAQEVAKHINDWLHENDVEVEPAHVTD
jgi:hypothetical protein